MSASFALGGDDRLIARLLPRPPGSMAVEVSEYLARDILEPRLTAAVKQFNVKNDHVVQLLETITERSGETKTEAVAHALQLYCHALEADERADAAMAFVRDHVHPLLEDRYRERPPSEAEQEDMVGMDE